MIVRPATPADVPAILALLKEFGAHGGNADWVRVSPDQLHAIFFGPTAWCAAHVAERGGSLAGMALWFLNFNFGLGRPGLYLEDLFVTAEARGAGVGEALMRALAAEAVRRDCVWMDWMVLTDNVGAQRFYARLGAAEQDEWRLWRLEGQALTDLAREI
jgi:GNAT superfamily N-acetyltransferase